MALVSVIIPARNEPYLAKTVEDCFAKAGGEVEVLVMLDGWQPDPVLKYHKNLIPIYRAEAKGMRNAINQLAAQASGKYLLKLDAHCMVGPGYDEILQGDVQDNDWLAVPTRYRLDPERWARGSDPLEYQYVTFPYTPDSLYGAGFHGRKWIGVDGLGNNMGRSEYYWMENARRHVKIDDIQIIQGSSWFMTKDFFKRIDGLDERYHYFYQEGNELCFKVWLSGGRCVVDKNTWYAHWHKDKPGGYGMSTAQKKETQRFSTWVWMNDKWPKATKTMSWFANSKFYPLPGWPANWQSFVKDDNGFRVFDPDGHDGFKIANPPLQP